MEELTFTVPVVFPTRAVRAVAATDASETDTVKALFVEAIPDNVEISFEEIVPVIVPEVLASRAVNCQLTCLQ